jgi:hypothetical protein
MFAFRITVNFSWIFNGRRLRYLKVQDGLSGLVDHSDRNIDLELASATLFNGRQRPWQAESF